MVEVSVIIPVYNVEDYIMDCLFSLEKQTFKDFEIVIVNDGSTDDSLNIIRRIKKSSKLNIQIINQVNSGVSEARNKGLDNSKGRYITFMDADDILDPLFLTTLYDCIKNHEYSLSICSFKYISDELDYNELKFNSKSDINVHKNIKIMKAYLLSKIKISICSLMVEKKILTNNNLYFNTNSKYSEDMDFVWKLLCLNKNIVFNSQELYLYRVRQGSAMSKLNKDRNGGFLLYENLESYIFIHEPEFSDFFNRYGVAKWVWSTVWQSVVASENYSEFQKYISVYNPKSYFKKLLTIPNLKVSLSSLFFLFSPKAYYLIIKVIGHKKSGGRNIDIG